MAYLRGCNAHLVDDPFPANSRYKGKTRRRCLSTQKLLEAEHGDFLRGAPASCYASQEELVKEILKGGFCSQNNPMGGFVSLEGGVETRVGDGVLDRRMFGFCFGKSRVAPEQLGPFSHLQAELVASKVSSGVFGGGKARFDKMTGVGGIVGGGNSSSVPEAGKKLLDRQTRDARTYGSNGFAGSTETMSLDMLRFLILERGFSGFRLVHFVHYEIRHHLGPFVTDKLQRRHFLRQDPEARLERNNLKLVLNGVRSRLTKRLTNRLTTSVCKHFCLSFSCTGLEPQRAATTRTRE